MMQKMKTPKIGLAKYLLIVPVAFALMFLSTAATSAYFNEVAVVETVQNDEPVVDAPEQSAQFPGGIDGMWQWLRENQHYFQEDAVEGRVVIQFIVERDGSIVDVQEFLRTEDQTPNPQLTAVATRIMHAMPNWQPARHGGETVRQRFTLPFDFGWR